MDAICAFPNCHCSEPCADAWRQYEESPLALTDRNIAALEAAIRAEGFEVYADPQTGQIKLERAK